MAKIEEEKSGLQSQYINALLEKIGLDDTKGFKRIVTKHLKVIMLFFDIKEGFRN